MLDVSRIELKYQIDTLDISQLKRNLREVMQLDPNSGLDGYTVRSVYFDTISDRDYYDKVDGLENRQKIRLRSYGEGSQIKLELKEKINKNQRKRSLVVSNEMSKRLLDGQYTDLLDMSNPFADEMYVKLTTEIYRPKCLVVYERYAFAYAANDVRVTIDSHLRASESHLDLFGMDGFLYPVQERGRATLEVKYSHFLPQPIRDVISLTEPLMLSNSKYCRARMIGKRGIQL